MHKVIHMHRCAYIDACIYRYMNAKNGDQREGSRLVGGKGGGTKKEG